MISPYIYAGLGKEKLSDEIIKGLVCDYFGISREQFMSVGRNATLVKARSWYAFIQRMFFRKEFRLIGNEIGGKDHSTVMFLVDKVATELRIYEEKKSEFTNFISGINHQWITKINQL